MRWDEPLGCGPSRRRACRSVEDPAARWADQGPLTVGPMLRRLGQRQDWRHARVCTLEDHFPSPPRAFGEPGGDALSQLRPVCAVRQGPALGFTFPRVDGP